MRSSSLVRLSLPLLLVLAACTPRRAEEQRVSRTTTSSAEVSARPRGATCPPAASSDVVATEGTRLFYADEQTGLSVFELEQPLRPLRVASSPFMGAPRALFLDDGVVWIVYVDADARGHHGHTADTVIRAVDARKPGEVRRDGEVAIPGAARDVDLSGGALHVLVDDEDGSSRLIRVTRHDGGLAVHEGRVLPGRAAALAPTGDGLAAVTVSGAGRASRTRVAWFDVGDGASELRERGAIEIAGGFPVWEHDRAHAVACDGRRRVRLVGCTTHDCGPSEATTLHVVDFADTPELLASTPIAARGSLVATRFAGDELLVAEPGPRGSRTSEVRVLDLHDDGRPRVRARVRVPGVVTTLMPREDGLLTLARLVADDGTVKLALTRVDRPAPGAARVRGTAVLGEAYTWSTAEDDARAVTFDADGRRVALPTTTWNAGTQSVEQSARVLDLEPSGPRLARTLRADTRLDRVLFAYGKIVTVGESGIEVFDDEGTAPPSSGFGRQ